MGVYVSIKPGYFTETLTPAFVPLSSGTVDTLNIRALAKMLSCSEDEVCIRECPMFAAFPRDQRVVLAFGTQPQAFVPADIPGNRVSGVHRFTVSPSVPHGFVPAPGKGVLVFYLQPGREFVVKPDYDAALTATEFWKKKEYPSEGEGLQNFIDLHASLYEEERTSDHLDSEQPREEYQCIIYPALGDKPFICKQKFLRFGSLVDAGEEEDGEYNAEPDFHVIERIRLLGDNMAGRSDVWDTLRARHADALRVVMRDNFVNDGSPPNRAIVKAVGGMPRHPWAGNIIAYRMLEDSEMAMDVEPGDMKIMLEYFRHYPLESLLKKHKKKPAAE
ncbi:hypothetical protein AURDEDRAFT_152403 [Auricularia subglabra TFB-10046 SS5]|nr:hypothetical protein AURDEDRAFT_152403 [Auricularia subglabra TFB-10046 SS5]